MASIYKGVQYNDGVVLYGYPNSFGTPIIFQLKYRDNLPVPANFVTPYIHRPYYPTFVQRAAPAVAQNPAKYPLPQVSKRNVGRENFDQRTVVVNESVGEIIPETEVANDSAESKNESSNADDHTPLDNAIHEIELREDLPVSESPTMESVELESPDLADSEQGAQPNAPVIIKVKSHKDIRKLKKLQNSSSEDLEVAGKKKQVTAASRKEKEKERKGKIRKAKQEELRLLAEKRKMIREEELRAEAERIRLAALERSEPLDNDKDSDADVKDGHLVNLDAGALRPDQVEIDSKAKEQPIFIDEFEESGSFDSIDSESESDGKTESQPDNDGSNVDDSRHELHAHDLDIEKQQNPDDDPNFVSIEKEIWLPQMEKLYQGYGIAIPEKPISIALQLQLVSEIEKGIRTHRTDLLSKMKEGVNQENVIFKYCQFLIAAYTFKPVVASMGGAVEAGRIKIVDMWDRIEARQPIILEKIDKANQEVGKKSKKKIGKDFIFIPQLNAWLDQKLIREHIRGTMNSVVREMRDSKPYLDLFYFVVQKHDALMDSFDRIPYSDSVAATLKESIGNTKLIEQVNQIIGALVLHKIIE